MGDYFDDADVISIYTRSQAIEDGVLVDVSELAREAGFRLPCAITAGVHALLKDIPEGSGEDFTGRLWDVLTLAEQAARRAPNKAAVFIDVILHTPDKPRGKTPKPLWMTIGPGDDPAPVLTILFPAKR